MEQNRTIDDFAIDVPCPIPWSSMKGNNNVRYCKVCDLNVHNLSSMTENEVNAFLESNSDGVCVNLFRRPDGTIVTDRCPPALRVVQEKAKLWYAASVAFLSLLLVSGPSSAQKAESIPPKPPPASSPEWDAALASFRAGRVDEAVTRFRNLSVKDTSGQSNYYLGLCLHGQQKYVEAKIQFAMAESRATDLQLKKNAQIAGRQAVQAMARPYPSVHRDPAPTDMSQAGKVAPSSLQRRQSVAGPTSNDPALPGSTEKH